MLESNIFFPAEWYRQEIIQIAWPDEKTDWIDILDEVRICYREIIKEITRHQKLLLVCRSVDKAQKELNNIDTTNIIFAEAPINDTWARDFGGITIFENGHSVILDFQFNGWAKKFDADSDNKITSVLFKQNIFKCNYKNMDRMVLEGGSIESNGKGTLLTTEQCLLSKNRNEHLSKKKITEELRHIFGCHTIHWLKHGYLEGDDTDGHIDTLARFVNENTIVYIQCTDKTDPHYQELNLMEKEILSLKTQEGKAYNCIPIPMAEAVFDEDGNRLPATYANFLITNEAVLVPIYGNEEKDNQAISVLEQVFPNKKVIGINCIALIKQHGSLHCITMQYPQGVM